MSLPLPYKLILYCLLLKSKIIYGFINRITGKAQISSLQLEGSASHTTFPSRRRLIPLLQISLQTMSYRREQSNVKERSHTYWIS